MHDNQLEDRVRAALRTEGDALPLTITTAELERRLDLRGRERLTRRMSTAAFGAAAVIVFAMVAASSGWFGAPGVGSGPNASLDTRTDVRVGDPPTASPLPEQLPDLPVPEGTVFVDETSANVPVEPTGVVETIGLAPVPPRSIYRVDVACLGPGLLRWTIGQPGTPGFLTSGDQVCDGAPGSDTLEFGIPPRDLPVFVHADSATAWHVVVSSIGGEPAFPPPALRGWWTAETGSGPPNAPAALGHCVSSASGADQCGPNWATATDATRIRITSGFDTTISFQLDDDWEITEARVTAVAAGTTAPEYAVGFVDTSSREIRVPLELEPGQWIVQVSLNATRGSGSFGAFYNFPLEVIAASSASIPTIEGDSDGDHLLLEPQTGECFRSMSVAMVGFDLDAADAAIDASGAGSGWIDTPLADGRQGRAFHGNVESAALAYGGIRLALGRSGPWIATSDDLALELRSQTTSKGRTIWVLGDRNQRVLC